MVLDEIVTLLSQNRQTVATAESCTGGMIASTIVSMPGVSEVFGEGYVTYSNEAKIKNLSVSADTLEQFGAVSEQTASEMASGVRRQANSDYGIATTGIAGPDGGTKEKPVGLVYISCASASQVKTIKCQFKGNRTEVRRQATEQALQLLLTCIKENKQ